MAPKKLPSTSAQSSSSDQIRYGHNEEHYISSLSSSIAKQAHDHKKTTLRSVTVRIVHVAPPTLVHADLASFKAIVQRFTGNEKQEESSFTKQASTKMESKKQNARKAVSASEASCVVSDAPSKTCSSCSASTSSSNSEPASSYSQLEHGSRAPAAASLGPWESMSMSDADKEKVSTFLMSSTLDMSYLNALDHISMGHFSPLSSNCRHVFDLFLH